jgi:hypothetical protein
MNTENALHEHSFQIEMGIGLGRITFNCLADDEDDAKQKAHANCPDREIVSVVKLARPPVLKARYTAYRTYPHDPFRLSHHAHGLTHKEVNDESRFPLGPQKDGEGILYVWQYGLNNGERI